MTKNDKKWRNDKNEKKWQEIKVKGKLHGSEEK